MTNVTDFVGAGLEQVRKSWDWFLVFGILLMILGVVCVGKAQTATTFSIFALGWVLAISGVVWLVNSFYAFSYTNHDESRSGCLNPKEQLASRAESALHSPSAWG